MPLLLFYILALVTAFLRIILLVLQYDWAVSGQGWFIFFCIYCPTTKLAIGLVQVWMVTELALKVKVGIQLARDPESCVTLSNGVLMRLQTIVLALIITVYLGFTAYEVYLSTQPFESWWGQFK